MAYSNKTVKILKADTYNYFQFSQVQVGKRTELLDMTEYYKKKYIHNYNPTGFCIYIKGQGLWFKSKNKIDCLYRENNIGNYDINWKIGTWFIHKSLFDEYFKETGIRVTPYKKIEAYFVLYHGSTRISVTSDLKIHKNWLITGYKGDGIKDEPIITENTNDLISLEEVKKSYESDNLNLRNPELVMIFKALSLDTEHFTKEAKTLDIFCDYFRKNSIAYELQCQVKLESNYRLDFSFCIENDKLCIECDENGHADRCIVNEIRREYILGRNGILMFRYNPDEKDFSREKTLENFLAFIAIKFNFKQISLQTFKTFWKVDDETADWFLNDCSYTEKPNEYKKILYSIFRSKITELKKLDNVQIDSDEYIVKTVKDIVHLQESYKQLKKENTEFKKRIAELEKENAELKQKSA